MAKIAYFDCISGISGDMTLGALVDLGVEVGEIEAAVRSMGLAELAIRSETVKKCGFRAVKVHIEHPPEHAHRHHLAASGIDVLHTKAQGFVQPEPGAIEEACHERGRSLELGKQRLP